MRDAAVAKDPALGVTFDIANEHYQKMMAQREALEKVGGTPAEPLTSLQPLVLTHVRLVLT